MQHHANIVPTMSAVMTAVATKQTIAPERRERLMKALSDLQRLTDKCLDHLPANVRQVVELIDAVDPKTIDVNPDLLALTKSRVRDAIAVSELVPEVLENGQPISRTPAWKEFTDYIDTHVTMNGLLQFMNWCSLREIPPSAVDDLMIERFMADLHRTSVRKHLYRVRRTTARHWNTVVSSYPELGLNLVNVPNSGLRRTRIGIEEFPPSFQTSWESFANWGRGEDAFSTDMRPVRLAASTLEVMFRRIHLAANALVRSGTPIASVRSLADLTTVEAFRSILRQRHEDANGEATYDNHYMALNLILIAREWVKVDIDVLAKLKDLKKRQPKIRLEMSDKNRRLVTKFDNPDVLQHFVRVPELIWSKVQAKLSRDKWLSRSDLAQAQAAIALAILMSMPIRRGNLVALEFDEHILLREGMPSTLFIRAADTKAFNDVEFDIPEQLVSWLIDYRDRIAPRLIGHRPKYLFSNVDGSLKGFMAVSYLIKRYMKLHLGLHLNPHVYRHLAAKFVLDDSPGGYEVVQQLLGHKKLEVTANFYAGLSTRRAGRLHGELLDKAMEQAKGSSHQPSSDAGEALT